LIGEQREQNLLRYIPTGGYQAKIKIHVRMIRHSLGTNKLKAARVDRFVTADSSGFGEGVA